MKNVFLIGMLFLSFTAFAQNPDPYFQIKEVRIQEVKGPSEAIITEEYSKLGTDPFGGKKHNCIR